MIRIIRALILLIFMALTPVQIFAQVQTGIPPFGSFGGGPDPINLANLNSHIVVPILHKPGRGTNFTYDLSFDSSIWYAAPVNGVQTWQPVANYGWRGQTEVTTGYISFKTHRYQCPVKGDGFYNIYDTFVYHDMFGTTHAYAGSSEIDCNGIFTGFGETAADGSGYSINVTDGPSATITSPGGTVYTPPINLFAGAGNFTDRNGNVVSVNSSGQFFDTLSSTTPVLTVSGSGTSTSPIKLVYTAPSGASAAYQVNYTNYTVATNFGNSTIHEYKSMAAVPLVSSIALPDGSQYTFTYEATPTLPTSGVCTPFAGTTCVTARIASITYPTGGTISYLYYNANNNFTACTTGNNGIFSDGSTSCLLRTTPDGTWTYTRAPGAGAASTTTIAAPQLPYDSAANQTVIQFQGIYETNRVTNQGASTVLQTTNTCYNGAALPCTGTAITLPITSRTGSTTLAGSGNQTDQHDMTYDGYGNLLTQMDYDYGSGAKGNLLRKTTITYASLGNIKAFSQMITETDSTSTTVSQTQYNYDETAVQSTSGTPQHTSVTGSRGNLTSVYSYTSGSYFLKSTRTYFDTGNVQTATDVNNAQTTYTYGACGNSFPTTISEPLSMSRTLTWDTNCTGGVATSVKDENSNTTIITYSDPYFWRPASISYPDGGSVSLTYNSPTTITIAQKMSSSQNIVSTILSDGLGRTKKRELNSDPSGVDYVDTTYDLLGRVYTISNPYRTTSDPTYGVTTYEYDALSRPKLIIPPDGTQTANNVSALYTNNCVTAADQASKQVKVCSNPLGYLTQVFEDPSGLNYETDYAVDPLGNIRTVTQKGNSPNNYRVRNYTYDFLSRLTQSVDPEAGTVIYSYDGNGNLLSTTSPAPNQTSTQTVTVSYCYDAFHRTTAKAYTYSPNTPPTCSGTPPTFPSPVATYLYDASTVNGTTLLNPIGRLSQSKISASVQSLYSYDTMGRIKGHYQTTPQYSSSPFQVNSAYDVAGDPTSTQYESGSGTTNITYTYTNNNAGLPTTLASNLVDANHPATLASNILYGPQGASVQGQYGNSLTETAAFNTTLQPCRVNLNSTGASLANCGSSTPTGTVLDLALGFNSGTSNNGNVASLAATGQQTFTRSYGYDGVNRLSAYSDTASSQACKGLSWGYDGWGNLLSQQTQSGTCLQFSSGVGTNNQLSSPYTYDAAGNMTHDATNTYYYDPEHRLIQVNGTLGTCSGATACYTYDAEGRRVEKVTSAQTLDYVYDNQNRVIAEFLPLSWATGYAYLGGQLLAEYTSGTTYFVTKDHLGSARLVSALNGSVVDSMDYYPHGIQMTGGSATTHKFTGDERDSETSLDHTPFRQYSSSVERWMTPDPAGLATADPTNPQSWNRYAYVLNNPLNSSDPLGLLGDGDKNDCPDIDGCDGGGGVGPCDFLIGECGGRGPRRGRVGPPETPIPEAPTDVGVPQDPGFGNGPIWTEQIPISSGPFSPWLIIENWTTLPNGSVVGTFANEPLCFGYVGGGCAWVFWDVEHNKWDQHPTHSALTTAGNMADPGVTAAMVVTSPQYIAMAGIAAWDALPSWFTDAFNGINDNPLFRVGEGWNEQGQRIWRWASGGRWGKGGPKLPWHWHLP